MTNMLKNRLKEFKLAGMANNIEERIGYANQKQLSYQQFLELLCEDEENNRRDNSYRKRYARARFPAYKTIEEFNFSFQPSIDKKQVNDALTCQYIEDKRNLLFVGNPGTGKTHLSIALGIKALQKNYKVTFTSVSEMLYQLHISKADNSYYKKLKEYLSVDLLILDELGFKKLPQYSADDFFEVISKRYEKGSCIITTNKTFEQWGDIFADNILSSAILDRVIHNSKIFKIKGSSYRAKSVGNEVKETRNEKEVVC